jgi:hypothetical protein
MTSQTKRKLANLGLGTAAIVSVVGWGAPLFASLTVEAIDGRYVKQAAFAAYKQTTAERALVDSVNYVNDIRDIRRALASLDSTDRCRRRQREFCR